jgi:rare lipoprotein A
MCLCRRSALWAGCTILVLVFLAAEELADATSAAGAVAEPVAPQYIEDDESNWEDLADVEDSEAGSDTGDMANALESVVAPAPLHPVGDGPTLPRAAQAATGGASQALKSGPGLRSESRIVNRVCRVTAYCDRGLTAAGVPSGVGQCAAPVDIPLGSTVYIPALHRKFVVTDRTHRRFRHNTVDVFIPSKVQCRSFGRRYLECEFTLVKEPVAYGELRLAQGG